MRRAGLLGAFVSVYPSHLQRSVNVACDGGRVCRPYIIVEKTRPRVKSRHIDDLKKVYGPYKRTIFLF
jgi:DNA-directed RNA polymerase III subunit RPC2